MAGANHIVQRLYGRELAPRVPVPVPGAPIVDPNSRIPGPNNTGRKRSAGEQSQDGGSPSKKTKIEKSAPLPIDTQEQVFAMEFMTHGDVRGHMRSFLAFCSLD